MIKNLKSSLEGQITPNLSLSHMGRII